MYDLEETTPDEQELVLSHIRFLFRDLNGQLYGLFFLPSDGRTPLEVREETNFDPVGWVDFPSRWELPGFTDIEVLEGTWVEIENPYKDREWVYAQVGK